MKCHCVWGLLLSAAFVIGYYSKVSHQQVKTFEAVCDGADHAKRGDLKWQPIDGYGTSVKTAQVGKIGFAKSAGRDREFDTADDVLAVRF